MGRRAWQSIQSMGSQSLIQLSDQAQLVHSNGESTNIQDASIELLERIEYQLQLANKVALQGIMHKKYEMSFSCKSRIGHRMKEVR